MLTPEQIKQRRFSMGGSDAATVLGLNPWKTKMQLWLEKTGRMEIPQLNSFQIRWGNKTEQAVRELFEEETGKKLRQRHQLLVHPEYEFISANLDGVVVGEKAIFEAKTTNGFKANAWVGDEVPVNYLIQVMHYLAVTGYEKGYIAVMIDNSKFVWKEIQRDEELIKAIIDAEVEFWTNNVLKDVAPEYDGTEASAKLLNELHPFSSESSEIELDNEADALIEDWEQAKMMVKQWEEQKKLAENKLKAMLGDFEVGQASEHVVSWKNITSNRIDSKKLKSEYPDVYSQVVKQTTSRRFDVKC